MSKPVAWITGAGGLLGAHLVQSAPQFAPDWQVLGLTRERLDLLNFAAVRDAFSEQRPTLVIHCAALSRSAACQADPRLAMALNVDVTRDLSSLAENVPFLFLSTDLVFDGSKGWYTENDRVHPLSVYAESKVAAEQCVLRNPRHTVVRLSLNAGVSPTGDRSFTEAMRQAWTRGETLKLFTDEFRCPIPAVVTARAVWEIVRRNQPGLFHLAGSERLSRWAIGELMVRRWPELRARMKPGSVKDSPEPPRPLDTSLDCSKIQGLLSFRLPGLTEWLAANPREPV
jgi:dTDP-4-dehydrorhamnose reductase